MKLTSTVVPGRRRGDPAERGRAARLLGAAARADRTAQQAGVVSVRTGRVLLTAAGIAEPRPFRQAVRAHVGRDAGGRKPRPALPRLQQLGPAVRRARLQPARAHALDLRPGGRRSVSRRVGAGLLPVLRTAPDEHPRRAGQTGSAVPRYVTVPKAPITRTRRADRSSHCPGPGTTSTPTTWPCSTASRWTSTTTSPPRTGSSARARPSSSFLHSDPLDISRRDPQRRHRHPHQLDRHPRHRRRSRSPGSAGIAQIAGCARIEGPTLDTHHALRDARGERGRRIDLRPEGRLRDRDQHRGHPDHVRLLRLRRHAAVDRARRPRGLGDGAPPVRLRTGVRRRASCTAASTATPWSRGCPAKASSRGTSTRAMQYLQGRLKVGVISLIVSGGLEGGFFIGNNVPKALAWVLDPTDTHFRMSRSILPATLTGVYGYGQASFGVNYYVVGGGVDIFAGAGAFSAPIGGRRAARPLRREPASPLRRGGVRHLRSRRDPRRARQRLGLGRPQPARPGSHLLRGHLRPARLRCLGPLRVGRRHRRREQLRVLPFLRRRAWQTAAALVQATSAGIERDGSTYVVLRWEAVHGVAGYNLYRRPAEGPARTSRPINGSKPIVPPSSARQLRAAVPKGSPEWEALAQGFTAADGAPAPSSSRIPRRASSAASPSTSCASCGRPPSAEPGHGPRRRARLHGSRSEGRTSTTSTSCAACWRTARERRLAVDIPVWAGHFVLPDPPSGARPPQAGDRRVLVLWNRNPYAATFVVQRATSPGGPFQQVNPKPVAFDMDSGLDGQPLPAPQPGFLDIGAWDPDGLPDRPSGRGRRRLRPRQRGHLLVPGRVAGHARPGRSWSAAVPATPVRSASADGPGRAPGVAEHRCRRAGRHVAQGDAQRREPRAARHLADKLRLPRRDPRGHRGSSLALPPTWWPPSRPTRRTPPRRSCHGPTSTPSSSRRTARSRSSIAS